MKINEDWLWTAIECAGIGLVYSGIAHFSFHIANIFLGITLTYLADARARRLRTFGKDDQ